jgi:hypothetical protein
MSLPSTRAEITTLLDQLQTQSKTIENAPK